MARQGGCRVRGGLWPAKGDLYVSKSAPRAVETGPWRQSRVEAEPQSRGDRAVEAEPRGGRAAGPRRQGRGGRAAWRQSRRAAETGPWRQSRVEAEPQSCGDRAVEAESREGRAAEPRGQSRGGRAAWGQSRRVAKTGPYTAATAARRWATGVGLGAGPLQRQGRGCSRGSSAAGPWRQGREGRAVGAEPQGEGGARHWASGASAGRQALSRMGM